MFSLPMRSFVGKHPLHIGPEGKVLHFGKHGQSKKDEQGSAQVDQGQCRTGHSCCRAVSLFPLYF
jgi:hypothetical protein